MKNPITTLHIQNFKTIKDMKVKCKRINIIIGKPNVGKSNFLEALSLLGMTSSYYRADFMKEFIRYNKFEDLFYDKEVENGILVDTNLAHVEIMSEIRTNRDNDYFEYKLYMDHSKEDIKKNKAVASKKPKVINEMENALPPYDSLSIDVMNSGSIASKQGSLLKKRHYPLVKKYEFQKGTEFSNRFHEFLMPPDGDNIFTIVNRNKRLLNEIGGFFKEYKLKFGLRMEDTSFEVRKQIGYYVYPTAYNLIADTLQRMIFNITAIASNKESILLFEEPEAHSFPPYVKLFAEKVIESKTNQFFITTHSPFILNTIIENTPLEEVAVFIATYDKFQTKLTELTLKELEDMLNYGNDIFFSSRLSD